MPSVRWSDENTFIISSPSPASSSHPPLPNDSPSSDLTLLGVLLSDCICHGAKKAIMFPLAADPSGLFEPDVWDSPATMPALSRVVLSYSPLQEHLPVEASDGKGVTVGDIVQKIHQWRSKPTRRTFTGLSMSEDGDDHFILQLI